MKKILLPVVLSFSLILSGCAIFPVGKNKAVKAEAKSREKIAVVEQAQAANNIEKLDNIATFAYGVSYALGKVTEPSLEITVANDMNQRVISIAGSPAVEKMKEMQVTIDNLTSKLDTEREIGKKQLATKDKEIIAVQEEGKSLVVAKDKEIKKYMNLAQAAAATSDVYKSKLDEYTGWFGLKAILKGLIQLFTTSIWFIIIGLILFLVLKFASSSSPIASSIFSIFETMGSWVINAVKTIVPKAVTIAGNVSKSVYNETSQLLTKIVDSIQWIKEQEKTTGQPVTVKQLLDQLDKSLDVKEKEMVTDIKKKLGYT